MFRLKRYEAIIAWFERWWYLSPSWRFNKRRHPWAFDRITAAEMETKPSVRSRSEVARLGWSWLDQLVNDPPMDSWCYFTIAITLTVINRDFNRLHRLITSLRDIFNYIIIISTKPSLSHLVLLTSWNARIGVTIWIHGRLRMRHTDIDAVLLHLALMLSNKWRMCSSDWVVTLTTWGLCLTPFEQTSPDGLL